MFPLQDRWFHMTFEKFNMSIRPMLSSDIDSVVRIEKVSFPTPWSAELFELELKRSPARYFVSERDGVLLGYMGYWEVPGEAHIITLATDPQERRRGVGRALIEHCLSFASRCGAKLATLEVRSGNKAGQALYEAAGFRPVAIRRKYYSDNQEDAIVMIRELVADGNA
jgi:[ribosomal protein S18]-alanine N-acetyltransferase